MIGVSASGSTSQQCDPRLGARPNASGPEGEHPNGMPSLRTSITAAEGCSLNGVSESKGSGPGCAGDRQNVREV